MSEALENAAPAHGRKGRGLLHWAPLGLVLAGLVLYGAFVGLAWWVQAGAHETGARAMKEFRGDEVEALIALIQSNTRTLSERNRAVYALGQIGDNRALPALEKFYTGGECDHSRFLCQKELKKAIDRCSGRNWAPWWLPSFPRAPARHS